MTEFNFYCIIFNVKNVLNLTDIKAVAFDIDGTLYRNWSLNYRMSLHFFRHCIFFLHYGIVRTELRKIVLEKDFIQVQDELMAKRLKCTPIEAHQQLDKIVYTGLKKYFPRIKTCSGAIELIKKLKENGYKIALLSDFPPEQKGNVWGILDYCDVVLGTEEIGALKPSAKPFEVLASKLQLPANQILYVGNSEKYDVVGSKKVGFKSALFISVFKGFFGKKSKLADITFSKYSQLENILFNKKI